MYSVCENIGLLVPVLTISNLLVMGHLEHGRNAILACSKQVKQVKQTTSIHMLGRLEHGRNAILACSVNSEVIGCIAPQLNSN